MLALQPQKLRQLRWRGCWIWLGSLCVGVWLWEPLCWWVAMGVFVLMCGFGSLCVGVGLRASLCWCVSLGVFVLVCG